MTISSDGSLFTAKPEPLNGLLGGIDKHKIALPNFQRPWIWEPEMVRDLIVSVAYRYPAGSLLSMPVLSENFALRPFEGAGDMLKEKANLMILDGQQRLTSLYQALYSDKGVVVKNRKYYFYLDVVQLMSDPDGNIEIGVPYFDQALFFVSEDKKGRRIRYQGLNMLYELNDRNQELEAGALPMKYIFDSDGMLADWKKDYLVQLSDNEMSRFLELDKKWDTLVRPWLDRIRNYPFPVVELRPDLPLNAICHIFEKVNSTGVPLDVFDLCNAILWARGFELNNKWKELKQEIAHDIQMQPLVGTYYLQGLSLLDSFDKKKKDREGRIAVACRKQDLMSMNKDTVEKWWDTLKIGYKEAGKFMLNQGIITEKILPYNTMIVPLAAILGYINKFGGKVASDAAWTKIQKWFWCSVFSQRYSSQTETNSAKDFEEVINWVNGGESPEIVKSFIFRADSLQEIQSIRNAIYRGILCLLAKQHALDFGGGGEINTALYYDLNMDHHHIFPTKYLKEANINDVRANTIVNKTLIGAAVNRSINGVAPSVYYEKWNKKLGKDESGKEIFSQILRTHAIDPDTIRTDSWDEFVVHRRESLRQLIISVCGGNVQLFSDEYDPSMEETDD